MKVALVQKVKALAGSEKYFLELVPALEKTGIKTEFICIYNKADEARARLFVEAYRRLGLTIHVLEVPSDRNLFKTLRFIRRIIRNGHFDLVHTHLIHADLWLALLKKFRRIRIPVVSTKHGYDEDYISRHGFDTRQLVPNRYYRICRFAEKYIHRSFAVSEGLRRFFVDAHICDANRIETIHHGFDLPEIAAKNAVDFRFSDKQIIVLGRIIPFKGHRYLVEALPIVKSAFPGFRLVIAGHGDEALIRELQSRIAELLLSDNVIFTGYTIDSNHYLRHSDVMVVPSVAEGFGLVFLEGMNARLPLVGFDVPATNEIIVNSETGILVPPYDSRLLGQALVRLLSDSTQAAAMAEAGHRRLKDYFNLDRMVAQVRTFYLSALASHNNSGRAK